MLAASLALSGCSTMLEGGGGLAPEATYAASPANIASLTEVIRDTPNDPQAYNMRGTVLAQAGRRQEALADFNKAIALDPKYAQAYANRGLLYRQNNQLDLALRRLRHRALDRSVLCGAHLGRGAYLAPEGRRAKGAGRFQPRDRDAARTMRRPITTAACSIRASASTSSRSTISRSRSGSSPREAEPYLGRGLSYLAADDLKSAAADLDNAVMLERIERRRLDQPRACLRAPGRQGKGRRLLRQGAQCRPALQAGRGRLQARRRADREELSGVLSFSGA